jgi:hypothetical protein
MASNDMSSRTRPNRQPNPDVKALRALRRATRDYIVVLEAGLQALDVAAIQTNPQLVYLRTALAVATGKRGSAFGTPYALEVMLTNMLGESGFAPEPEG